MGHKIDPRGLRIGINKTWNFRWYNKRNYKKLLRQDVMISEYIKKKFKHASISDIETERSVAKVRIVINTNSPGMLIGRGGKGLEDLKKDIERRFLFNEKLRTQIDVNEVRTIEENAQLLANDVAMQLEKRISFRRAMKMMISKVMYNRNVLGVKIELSGRLGGAEMSRTEWLSKGSLPLHTLRANIDFAKATAYTTYGTIGVKVWLNKKTEENSDNNSKIN